MAHKTFEDTFNANFEFSEPGEYTIEYIVSIDGNNGIVIMLIQLYLM